MLIYKSYPHWKQTSFRWRLIWSRCVNNDLKGYIQPFCKCELYHSAKYFLLIINFDLDFTFLLYIFLYVFFHNLTFSKFLFQLVIDTFRTLCFKFQRESVLCLNNCFKLLKHHCIRSVSNVKDIKKNFRTKLIKLHISF